MTPHEERKCCENQRKGGFECYEGCFVTSPHHHNKDGKIRPCHQDKESKPSATLRGRLRRFVESKGGLLHLHFEKGVIDDIAEFIGSELDQATKRAAAKENLRLKAKAFEYKDKGFELETFIYSGFLPDFPNLSQEQTHD